MASPGANEPRFFFDTPNLPEGTLEVVDFVGREAISQVFRFELNLVSEDPSVPFSELMNHRATLTMASGAETSYVHGVVADFQQGSPVGDYVRYRAVLVPRLWRLMLTFQSRVFQHLSVPEIVRKVLQSAGFGPDDFRFALAASYPPREYCTQYKETDLAFVSRLLEHEGIQFFFEQQAQREVLVLTDDRGENPPIGGGESVTYRPAAGMAPAHEETVHEFVFREQMVPGRVILKDYNYETPEADLRAESQISDEMPGTHYEYGAQVKDAEAAGRLARVRNEEIDCRRRIGNGEGTCMRLRAGHRFTLDEHYRLDFNQPYLVTEVAHHGTQRGAVGMQAGEDRALPYYNTFACVPATVSFRPPRVTPQPRLPGVMTARVESGGGEYAHIDDEGRYRIKLPFDLAETDRAQGSKPIRLAQPYSGADYGMHFPVHADAEMVFACVDGDVDRPLGLSTVPNPAQGSPVRGENHTRNVIRTASRNEIYMEDEKGNERIKLYSPHRNSLIQLGAPNCPVDGIVTSTDGFSGIHGAEGVYLTAWDNVTNSDWVAKVGSIVVGGAAFLTAQALARRVGKFDVFPKLQAAMTGAKGFALAGAAAGAFGFGEGLPGITMAAPGHVRTVANGSIQGLSAAGIAFITGATTELCAALGISIASGTGVNIFAATDTIRTVAGKGAIEITAESEKISVEAEKEIKLRSMSSDIRLLTLKDNKILLQSRNLIRQEARGNLELKSEQEQVVVEAEKDVRLKSAKERVVIEAEKEIVLKCGDAELILSPDDIILTIAEQITVALDRNKILIDGARRGTIAVDKQGRIAVSGTSITNVAKMKYENEATMYTMHAKGISQLKASLHQIG